jgi:alpha-beta hydrolase superfamily lysophospholipase
MVKKVTIKNSTGESISGVLKQKSSTGPLLLVCHGFNSSNEHPALVVITNKLSDMGNATFAFNFSPNKNGFDLRQQVSDLIDVVAHFKGKRKLVLWGGSFGALSCAVVAAQSRDVDGLVTTNGFFGGRRVGMNIMKIYLAFRILALVKKSYKDIWSYLQNNLTPEKITIPTLIMHALPDRTVAISQSRDFYEKLATRKKELYVLQDADHHLTKESYRQEVADVVDTWLKKLN